MLAAESIMLELASRYHPDLPLLVLSLDFGMLNFIEAWHCLLGLSRFETLAGCGLICRRGLLSCLSYGDHLSLL